MAERIINSQLDEATKKQLREIPDPESPDFFEVVEGFGIRLLPTTVMVLLHEANSRRDEKIIRELQTRLLGHGGPDGMYHNGVANPYIEGYARRMGFKTREEIEDFRQECHQRMVQHIVAPEGESLGWEINFKLGMNGVAIDVWRYFKARNRSRGPSAHPLHISLESAAYEGGNPLDATERAELLAALRRALALLPPKQAEAIRRHDLEGETYAEIARSEGKNDGGTIRARRNEGLRKLGLELSYFNETDEPTERDR